MSAITKVTTAQTTPNFPVETMRDPVKEISWDILKGIFGHLNRRDLQAAICVTKEWSRATLTIEAAQTERWLLALHRVAIDHFDKDHPLLAECTAVKTQLDTTALIGPFGKRSELTVERITASLYKLESVDLEVLSSHIPVDSDSPKWSTPLSVSIRAVPIWKQMDALTADTRQLFLQYTQRRALIERLFVEEREEVIKAVAVRYIAQYKWRGNMVSECALLLQHGKKSSAFAILDLLPPDVEFYRPNFDTMLEATGGSSLALRYLKRTKATREEIQNALYDLIMKHPICRADRQELLEQLALFESWETRDRLLEKAIVGYCNWQLPEERTAMGQRLSDPAELQLVRSAIALMNRGSGCLEGSCCSVACSLAQVGRIAEAKEFFEMIKDHPLAAFCKRQLAEMGVTL